jgi:hypothetical protein
MAANITLTASLETILGGAGLAGYIEITLCNYGPVPPRIIGTGMLADAGIPKLEGPGASFSIRLYGNDQITPDGTYYSITIYDETKQPIQTANYILDGSGTFDLSNLSPIVNPPYSLPSNYIIVNPATGNVTINNNGWNGPIVIDLTLTGDVNLTLIGFMRGQIVQFIIRQDGVGGRVITWPANLHNPAAVNPAANSVTTANFVNDHLGVMYPQLGWS